MSSPEVALPSPTSQSNFAGLQVPDASTATAQDPVHKLNELLRKAAEKYALGNYKNWVDVRYVEGYPDPNSSMSDNFFEENGKLVVVLHSTQDDPTTSVKEGGPETSSLPYVLDFYGSSQVHDPLLKLKIEMALNEINIQTHHVRYGDYQGANEWQRSAISTQTIIDNFQEIGKTFGYAFPSDAVPTFSSTSGGFAIKAIPAYITGYQTYQKGTSSAGGQMNRGATFPDGSVLEVGPDGQVAKLTAQQFAWSQGHVGQAYALDYLQNTLGLPPGTQPLGLRSNEWETSGKYNYSKIPTSATLTGYKTPDGQTVTFSDGSHTINIPPLTPQDVARKKIEVLRSTGLNSPEKQNLIRHLEVQIGIGDYIEKTLGYPKGSEPRGRFDETTGEYVLSGVTIPKDNRIYSQGNFDYNQGNTGQKRIKLDLSAIDASIPTTPAPSNTASDTPATSTPPANPTTGATPDLNSIFSSLKRAFPELVQILDAFKELLENRIQARAQAGSS